MPTRRDFLKGACGATVLALGAALLPDEAMAATGITRLPDGRVVVRVKKIPAMTTTGGAVNLGTVKGVPVAVVCLGPGSYRALDLRCTHQGVTVGQGSAGWSCPAHGSQFGIDGSLKQGPAGRPLNTVLSTFDGKKLTVG